MDSPVRSRARKTTFESFGIWNLKFRVPSSELRVGRSPSPAWFSSASPCSPMAFNIAVCGPVTKPGRLKTRNRCSTAGIGCCRDFSTTRPSCKSRPGFTGWWRLSGPSAERSTRWPCDCRPLPQACLWSLPSGGGCAGRAGQWPDSWPGPAWRRHFTSPAPPALAASISRCAPPSRACCCPCISRQANLHLFGH